MNKRHAPKTFEEWVHIATQQLPAHLYNVVKCELYNHFKDAFEAYLQEGMEPEAAQKAALTDLGNPAEFNQDLLRTHVSRNQALATIFACAGYVLLLLFFPVLEQIFGQIGSYVIQDLFSTGVLIFILAVFIRLIGFNIRKLNSPARLLIGSLLLGSAVRVGYFIVFQQQPFVGPSGDLHWETSSILGIFLDFGFILAELLAGVSAAWLGWGLYRIEEKFYGLLRPIAILLVLIGLFAGGLVVSLLIGSITLAGLFSAVGYALVAILMAVMILAFFRAAFRKPSQSILTT